MSKEQPVIKRPPLWIMIALISSIFIEIFTTIVGIDNIENYEYPYIFGLISGGFGLITGILIAKKFKSQIAVNPTIKKNYGIATMHISTGFIGFFLLVGSIINNKPSEIETNENFFVINKYRQEAHFQIQSSEINSLFVGINGVSHRLLCNPHYWDNIRIGQPATTASGSGRKTTRNPHACCSAC